MRLILGSCLMLFYVMVQCKGLQEFGDEELLQLIKSQDKLIVLFSKSNCDTCKRFITEIEGLENDFKKDFSAITIIVNNSHLAKLYSPTKEPAIVFFRHGIPLLYDGTPNENEIYDYLKSNQQPAVKELTDNIFEHITQAATGATTGDWFVMFYGASCVECQRLHAVWEGVGATLRGRVNVARMDSSLGGVNTAKRFNVNQLPTFLFFRHGKVYKYDIPKNDIKSFVSFAQDWYKNAKGTTVPLLESPFDELVNWCVELIKQSITIGMELLIQYQWVVIIGIAGFGLVGITAVIALMKAGRSKTATKTKKEKKSK